MIETGKEQTAGTDQQVETFRTRIMIAVTETFVRSHEGRIDDLERRRIILKDQVVGPAEPPGNFEDKLEPARTVLAPPGNSGTVAILPCAAGPAAGLCRPHSLPSA